MQFGICKGPEQAAAIKTAGWDFVEGNVQSMFRGESAEVDLTVVQTAALPVPSANCLVPGSLAITGPDVNIDAVRAYISNVVKRAAVTETRILVFGSGAARNVPDGFDRDEAKRQIIAFARMSADLAGSHDVTIVVEPLNRRECNIINSVSEAMEYVREVNHTYFKCLVDTYHFWVEDESLASLDAAMPWIAHVHVADKVGRKAPGESGEPDQSPYGDFFRVLKAGNYRGLISVESAGFDIPQDGKRILTFLREQWNNA